MHIADVPPAALAVVVNEHLSASEDDLGIFDRGRRHEFRVVNKLLLLPFNLQGLSVHGFLVLFIRLRDVLLRRYGLLLLHLLGLGGRFGFDDLNSVVSKVFVLPLHFLITIMAFLLPHLDNGWEVDQAILSEEDRVVCIRFGRDADPTCMKMDEVLVKCAEAVQNFAVFYVVDI